MVVTTAEELQTCGGIAEAAPSFLLTISPRFFSFAYSVMASTHLRWYGASDVCAVNTKCFFLYNKKYTMKD